MRYFYEGTRCELLPYVTVATHTKHRERLRDAWSYWGRAHVNAVGNNGFSVLTNDVRISKYAMPADAWDRVSFLSAISHSYSSPSLMRVIKHWAKQEPRWCWYLLVDDDTLVLTRNVPLQLAPLDAEVPILAGDGLQWCRWLRNCGIVRFMEYISGGPGLIFSRRLVERIAHNTSMALTKPRLDNRPQHDMFLAGAIKYRHAKDGGMLVNLPGFVQAYSGACPPRRPTTLGDHRLT